MMRKPSDRRAAARGRRARTQAEEALRRSEQKYRTLVETSHDWIWSVDTNGCVAFANAAVVRILGYEPEEMLGRPFSDFVRPEDVAKASQCFASLMAGEDLFCTEVQMLRKDGGLAYLICNATAVRDEHGNIIGTTGTAVDITARKQAEEERARLSAAVEQAPDAIMITNPQGTIVYVNPASERMTGYSRAELYGQERSILRGQWQDREAYRQMQGTIARGEVWHGSQTHRHKDGSFYEVDSVISPVHDASGRLINFVGLGRDVTHERQIEAQLRQAQKLEAIGRLAGGVAHDFNNQLMVINGCVQFLLAELPEADPRRRDAERIAATVNKSTRLVRQLLAFSRQQPLETRSLNLTDLVNEMAPMLRLLLGEQIALHVQLAVQLWRVKADRSQVEQVVMNLVGNARDAMARAGELTVGNAVTLQTANVELNDLANHVSGDKAEPGPYVMLAVSDNGSGMPPDVQERLFEPFFTTKEVGKGSGLGLATVFGIVKQHGGHIACSSEPGHGTAFRIYLPRDHSGDAFATPASLAATHVGRAAPAKGTVLVVEDEENVREVLVRVLEDSGYRVCTAAGAEEALAVAARINDPIDLLLTDVVMPGESGYTLARRLLQEHRATRVLFISGYLASTLDMSDLPGARFLQKPFGLDDLLHAVGEVLSR